MTDTVADVIRSGIEEARLNDPDRRPGRINALFEGAEAGGTTSDAFARLKALAGMPKNGLNEAEKRRFSALQTKLLAQETTPAH